MTQRSLFTALILGFFLLSASLSHAALIQTEVTANINGFNPGPYAGGDAISVQFEWESGIARDWGTTSASYFDSAVDNIVINVGSHTITGTDARVVQYNNNTDDQVSITFGTRFGNTHGTVGSAPDVNGQSFEVLTIVFRDASNGLFPSGAGFDSLIATPSVNLYVDSLTMYFTGADVLNVHNRAFTMTEATAQVPVPGVLWLVLIGVVSLRSRFKASQSHVFKDALHV